VSALDQRHRRRQAELAQRVAARLGLYVGNLETLDETELAAYGAAAYPVVAGGQARAASLAAGYGVALARRRPEAIDVSGALEASGVLVAPDSRSLVAPVLRARLLVSEGQSKAAALAAAASYAHALSSNDLQAAQRVGLDEGVSAVGARVAGYQKELSPDACEWCQLTAERTYSSADSVPFHDRDACSVAPVLA
jgi:hypothetical protein